MIWLHFCTIYFLLINCIKIRTFNLGLYGLVRYKLGQEPDVHPLEDLVTVDGHAVDTETVLGTEVVAVYQHGRPYSAILLKISG